MPASTCSRPVPGVPGAALDPHVPCAVYGSGVHGALISVDVPGVPGVRGVPGVVRVPGVPGVRGTLLDRDVPRAVRVPGVLGTLVG